MATVGDACAVDEDCAAIGGVTTLPGCVGSSVQIAQVDDRTGRPESGEVQACLAIREQWRTRAAELDDGCEAADDCTTIEGARSERCSSEEIYLWDGHSWSCAGRPVDEAALHAAAELAPLATSFHDFDCPAARDLGCVDHRCVVDSSRGCRAPTFDAGVADAS